jgi:hypothetical protein
MTDAGTEFFAPFFDVTGIARAACNRKISEVGEIHITRFVRSLVSICLVVHYLSIIFTSAIHCKSVAITALSRAWNVHIV